MGVFGDEAGTVRNGEFLIESGAATSVFQQSLAGSLGGGGKRVKG